MQVARSLRFTVGAVLVGLAAGLGAGTWATSQAAIDMFGVPDSNVLLHASTEQILRRYELGLDLGSEVTPTEELNGLPAGESYSVFEILAAQGDLDAIELLAVDGADITPKMVGNALCIVGRLGHTSLVEPLVGLLPQPRPAVRCDGGELPSNLARSSGHGGAMRALEKLGI